MQICGPAALLRPGFAVAIRVFYFGCLREIWIGLLERDIDIDVDVDVDWYSGCLEGVSKSVQVAS